jgi:hypothetical protein
VICNWSEESAWASSQDVGVQRVSSSSAGSRPPPPLDTPPVVVDTTDKDAPPTTNTDSTIPTNLPEANLYGWLQNNCGYIPEATFFKSMDSGACFSFVGNRATVGSWTAAIEGSPPEGYACNFVIYKSTDCIEDAGAGIPSASFSDSTDKQCCNDLDLMKSQALPWVLAGRSLLYNCSAVAGRSVDVNAIDAARTAHDLVK